MSYIAALRCAEGIILIADTQETVRDEKQYSEKLEVSEDSTYPLAIGGAGVDELTDAFSQELVESVMRVRPVSAKELRKTITSALETVYAKDMAVSALPKQFRTGEFLIGAKPTEDGFTMFRVKGKRIFPLRENFALIGFATAANKALLSRMYREELTMHRAVLLGAYLVSQSKARDLNVGGETRIAIVGREGAYLEERAYVANVEARADEFARAADDLFLECTDLSIRDEDFPATIEAYRKRLLELRNKYKTATAWWMISDMASFAQRDRSYPYLSGSFSLGFGPNGTAYSEVPLGRAKQGRDFIDVIANGTYSDHCGQCRTAFEYRISVANRRHIVRGQLACPVCGTLNETIAIVSSFRKAGNAEWIEVSMPSDAQKSEPEP